VKSDVNNYRESNDTSTDLQHRGAQFLGDAGTKGGERKSWRRLGSLRQNPESRPGILSLAEVEVGAGGKLGSTQIPSPLVLVVYLHTGHIVDHYNIGANDYSVGGINYEAIKNPVG